MGRQGMKYPCSSIHAPSLWLVMQLLALPPAPPDKLRCFPNRRAPHATKCCPPLPYLLSLTGVKTIRVAEAEGYHAAATYRYGSWNSVFLTSIYHALACASAPLSLLRIALG